MYLRHLREHKALPSMRWAATIELLRGGLLLYAAKRRDLVAARCSLDVPFRNKDCATASYAA